MSIISKKQRKRGKKAVICQEIRNGFTRFLGSLKTRSQLVTYPEPVYPEPDIRAIARAALEMGDTGPAVLIDQIKGYQGKKVVVNVHGSWSNDAVMLGMDKKSTVKEMFYELNRRWGKGKKRDPWFQMNRYDVEHLDIPFPVPPLKKPKK